jgi:Mn-dependent DtxR family transcriptional regulator
MAKRKIRKNHVKSGDHYEWNKVKSGIIKYILKNNGPKKESDIREHLEKEFNVIDQRTINKHLHKLEEYECIELIPHKGRANYWDITKIKHLKSIRKKFPEITLNKYEKSVNIVLKKFNFIIGSSRAKKMFVQLSLSSSFFVECLDTEIETLCSRASKIYQSDEDLNIERLNEKLTQEAYYECMRRIMKILEVWPVADNEYINDSVNLRIYPNFSHHIPKSIISEEKFKSMLKEIKCAWEEKDHRSRGKKIVKELSFEISREIISNKEGEIFEESLQMQEVLKKMSYKISEKLVEDIPVNVPELIYSIIFNRYQHTSIILDRLFNHFYHRDVIDGIDSEEEVKFVSQIENILNSTNIDDVDQWTSRATQLDQLYNKYYEDTRKSEG